MDPIRGGLPLLRGTCFKDSNFHVDELDIHGGMLLKGDILTVVPLLYKVTSEMKKWPHKRVGFS